MDYSRNEDHLCDDYGYNLVNRPAVSGIQYRVIQDLSEEPVTLEFFKEHIRVDFNVDDNLLPSYLKSARQYLEQWSQLSFGEKKIRLTALRLPQNWKLMYGPVVSVETEGMTLFGDILKNGGNEVSVEYTTGWEGGLPEAIKLAICKRAAGDYMIRENVILTEKGSLQEPSQLFDEAQKLLLPYRNQTFI